MVPGFKARLDQELRHYMTTMPQYAELSKLEPRLRFVENVSPPNIVSWIGASLLASLNDEIGMFMYKP